MITPYDIQEFIFDLDGNGIINIGDITMFQEQVAGTQPLNAPGLAAFLMRHLNVAKTAIAYNSDNVSRNGEMVSNANFAFYTTDGLRFEVPHPVSNNSEVVELDLYESDTIKASANGCHLQASLRPGDTPCSSIAQRCGSLGLITNPNKTAAAPCIIMVDVNGDKKPNPKNKHAYTYDDSISKNAFSHDEYKVPLPGDNILSDVFTILITDRHAIPYGVVAQRTMYDEEQ